LNSNELKIINKIVSAIKKAGYDPYSQLCGYVETNDECYITRKDNARELIKTVTISSLKDYINQR